MLQHHHQSAPGVTAAANTPKHNTRTKPRTRTHACTHTHIYRHLGDVTSTCISGVTLVALLINQIINGCLLGNGYPQFACSLQDRHMAHSPDVTTVIMYNIAHWWDGLHCDSSAVCTVGTGSNDIFLYDTSPIASDILWYQLIPHC
jgi:hypothetical protein